MTQSRNGSPVITKCTQSPIGRRLADQSLDGRRPTVMSLARSEASIPDRRASGRSAARRAIAAAIESALGSATMPLTAVLDEFERAAGVGGRDNRFARQKGFERHVAIVLVDRRVDDREGVCVQADELSIVDVAGKRDAVAEIEPADDIVEPASIGSVSGDDELDGAVRERERVDDQLDSLFNSRRPTDNT
jgi:hypothetical protein